MLVFRVLSAFITWESDWSKQKYFVFFFHFLGYFIAAKLSFDFYTCLYSKKKKCWWWIPKMMAFLHEDISQYAKVQFNIQPSILRNWALTHLPLTYVKKRHWYQELTLAVVARWFPVVIRKMNNIFVCFCFFSSSLDCQSYGHLRLSIFDVQLNITIWYVLLSKDAKIKNPYAVNIFITCCSVDVICTSTFTSSFVHYFQWC